MYRLHSCFGNKVVEKPRSSQSFPKSPSEALQPPKPPPPGVPSTSTPIFRLFRQEQSETRCLQTNAVPRSIIHIQRSFIHEHPNVYRTQLPLAYLSDFKFKHHQTRLVIINHLIDLGLSTASTNLAITPLPNQTRRFITINSHNQHGNIDQSSIIISYFLNCTLRTELLLSMGRRPLPIEERKARNAARQRRWRAKRKASVTKPHLKKRVGFLDVLQATIQRRLPAVLLRAGCTLSQSGARMMRNMSSWLPKLRQHNKPRASRSKTITIRNENDEKHEQLAPKTAPA